MDPLVYMSLTYLLGGALAYAVYWLFQKFDRR
jgi:hypothetical protein